MGRSVGKCPLGRCPTPGHTTSPWGTIVAVPTRPEPSESLGAAHPASSGRLRALLRGLRPTQWTKNGAVLAGLIFAHRVGDLASIRATLLAILAFCAISSATYLGNDIVDREADRRHPVKRNRPIASGELPVPLAIGAAVALALGSLALSIYLGVGFTVCVLLYVAVQIAYSLVLKHLVIVDVFAIASGFVLRVIAGAVAIDVPISHWLQLCTLLLALFLALAKRYAEVKLLADDAREHRPILADYDPRLLDQLLSIVAACAVLAYALYTVAPETVSKFQGDRLKFTVPFVLFGLFRYLFLVHKRGSGGQPERVLLRDRPTQVNLLLYVAVVAWAIYMKSA